MTRSTVRRAAARPGGIRSTPKPREAGKSEPLKQESVSEGSVSCSGCSARWSGFAVCHCSACHRTFVRVSYFDAHRSAEGEHGTCLDPANLKGMEFRDGMWRGVEMTEEQKARVFGGKR